GAFEIIELIDFATVMNWFNGSLPTAPAELVRVKVNFDKLGPTAQPSLTADVSSFLPGELTGSITIDRPILSGQLVFGMDTSLSPFYLVTQPDLEAASRATTEEEYENAFATTKFSGQLGLGAELGALSLGVINVHEISGYATTKFDVDFSRVALGEEFGGKLRLHQLDELANAQITFDGGVLNSFEALASATMELPGLDETQPLTLVGTIVKEAGPLEPIQFQVRNGSFKPVPESQRAELATRTLPGDDAYEDNDTREAVDAMIAGGVNSANLGDLLGRERHEPFRLYDLTLRDSADWFRFETTEVGSVQSFVQIDFENSRGDLDLEVYRQTEGGLELVGRDVFFYRNTARVSLWSQPAGVYYARVYDDGLAYSPIYAFTVDQPGRVPPGFNAELAGFELRNLFVNASIDTNGQFQATTSGIVGLPFSIQDGGPLQVAFQGNLSNEGFSAEVATRIGGDALMTLAQPTPSHAIWNATLHRNGGYLLFDYTSSADFKFAGYNSELDRWEMGTRDASGWTVAPLSSVVRDVGVDFDSHDQARVELRLAGARAELWRVNGDAAPRRLVSQVFATSVEGGRLGLGAQHLATTFDAVELLVADSVTGSTTSVLSDTFDAGVTSDWQMLAFDDGGESRLNGLWWVNDQGELGADPTGLRFGSAESPWLRVDTADVAGQFSIDLSGTTPVVDAGIVLDNLNVLVWDVESGGTRLDPDDPNSPQGLVAIRDGEATLDPNGLYLSAGSASAAIAGLIEVTIEDPTLDLTADLVDQAGRPLPLFAAGDISVRIPRLSQEESFVTIEGGGAGQLFGISKPTFNNPIPQFLWLDDSVTLALDPGLLIQELDLGGLLPLDIQRLGLRFNHLPDSFGTISNLADFDLLVDAQIDFDDPLFDALPFDPVLAVGKPEPGSGSSSCAAGEGTINLLSTLFSGINLDGVAGQLPPDEPLCQNGFVSAELHLPSLLTEHPELALKQFGPIYLGIESLPIANTPLLVTGAIYLGEFQDGQFDGNVGGIVRVTDGDGIDTTFSAVGSLTQRRDGDTTITRLETLWNGEADVKFRGYAEVNDATASLRTFVENYTTPNAPFNLCPSDIPDAANPGEFLVTCGASLESVGLGEIKIALGPWIELIAKSGPGDEPFVDVNAGPDEPFIYLRHAEARFTDAVPDVLANKGIEAGGFGLGRDGTVYLLADNPESPEYDGARFLLKDNSLDGNLFGFPEWFPLRISEIGLRFENDGADLDISISDVIDDPGQAFLPLADPSNYSFVVSGGLQGDPNGFPITGQVKELVTNVNDLMGFLENGCYLPENLLTIGTETCPFPVEDLSGATIGIEPFKLGPIAVGGTLGLNLHTVTLSDSTTRTALYGTVKGKVAYADIGVGVEVVLTQYGPALARLFAGVPIPIGTLVGSIGGSVVPVLGTAIGGSAGTASGFILTGFDGALIFDAQDINPVGNPLDVLTEAAFAKPLQLSNGVVEAAIEKVVNERYDLAHPDDGSDPLVCDAIDPTDPAVIAEQALKCYTWSHGFRLVGSAFLTNIHAQGQIGGRVFVGANVGLNSAGQGGTPPVNAQLFARGDLEVLGQSVGTATLVFDFSDPINPTVNVAAGIPGSGGGWLSSILPIRAQIGLQFDTDGLAAGSLVAVRSLLEDVGTAALQPFLTATAETLEQERLAFLQELDDRQAEIARLQAIESAKTTPDPTVVERAEQALRVFRNRYSFFKTILDVNNDWVFQADDESTTEIDEGLLENYPAGVLSEPELATPITFEVLRDRILGLLPDPEELAGAASGDGTISVDPQQVALAVAVAGRLIEELLRSTNLEGMPPAEFPVELCSDVPNGEACIPRVIFDNIDQASTVAIDALEESGRQGLALIGNATAHNLAEAALEESIDSARKMARFSAVMASVVFQALGDAADDFFTIINPTATLEGFVQPVILGIPFGPPRERIVASIAKDSFELQAKVRLLEKLQNLVGIPLPVSDVLEARIHVPFGDPADPSDNLYRDLYFGQPPTVNLNSDEPWFVALAGSLELLSAFELGQISGMIFPAGPAEEPDRIINHLRDEQGLIQIGEFGDSVNPDQVLVTAENYAKLQQGGILVDGRLTLPRLITDPFNLFNEIADQLGTDLQAIGAGCSEVTECILKNPGPTFEFLSGLTEIPGQVSALDQIGQLQMYVPDVLSDVLGRVAAELTENG
ncbi:MAG: hypothetical protein KDA60_09335, partial [Planctomycetales bacterium]|nr:hypothetical protein [Planctomycetales bacterium]